MLDALERGSPQPTSGAGASPPVAPALPVPADRLVAARGAYAQLHHAALRAVSDLAALQQRLAGLLAQAQAARMQAEWEEGGLGDPMQLIDRVREDHDRAAREVGAGSSQNRISDGASQMWAQWTSCCTPFCRWLHA